MRQGTWASPGSFLSCHARSTYPKRSAIRSTRAASMRSISERTSLMSAHSQGRFGSISLASRLLGGTGPPLLADGEASGCILDRLRGLEQRRLVEGLADELQAARRSFRGEPGRNRKAGKAGHVHRHGEDVLEIHGERVAGLLAERERGRRRGRRQHDVDLAPGLVEVALDKRADLLRLEVVGVVVAGG